jgi:hypothetical protein
MSVKSAILQSARIAELRTSAMENAALCKRRAPMTLPAKSSRARHRCLLILLKYERWRNEKLIDLVTHG